MSADVDYNLLINGTDAQSIQNRFVKDVPFTKPWVFGNATTGTAVPGPLTVQVNGNSVSGYNILGMSTGDFNGSFDPAALPVNVTLNTSGLTMAVPAGKPFDLPINSAANITFGAVSLILNVPPANIATVTNVSIAGSAIPVSWNVSGNVLRIGWNSATLDKVLAGKPLVIITMMAAPSTAVNTFQVTLVQDVLNEISDGLFKPIITSLTVDNVSISATVPALTVSAFPNPATTSTTITYLLPEMDLNTRDL